MDAEGIRSRGHVVFRAKEGADRSTRGLAADGHILKRRQVLLDQRVCEPVVL